MSKANVQFLTVEGNPIAPGEKPCRFTFRCINGNRGRDSRLTEVTCANLLIAGAMAWLYPQRPLRHGQRNG